MSAVTRAGEAVLAPQADQVRPGTSADRVIFFITAAADPGMLSRLIEPFAKLGIVPTRVHMSAEGRSGDELSADIRVSDVDPRTVHLLEKAVRGTFGVRSVIRTLG